METNTVILDRGTYDDMQEQLSDLKANLRSRVVYEKPGDFFSITIYTDDEAIEKMAEKIKSLEEANEEQRLRLIQIQKEKENIKKKAERFCSEKAIDKKIIMECYNPAIKEFLEEYTPYKKRKSWFKRLFNK